MTSPLQSETESAVAGGRSRPLGAWTPGADASPEASHFLEIVRSIDQTVFAGNRNGETVFGRDGRAEIGVGSANGQSVPLLGIAAPTLPEQLGDPSFRRDYGVRYNYVAGAMANGIASVDLVEACAGGGILSFFGAAGLAPSTVEEAIVELRRRLGDLPFGVNLIHSPHESSWEDAVVDLLIAHDVTLVEASAYLGLTPAVVRYRLHGIDRDANGGVVTPNRIVAKVSRVEVATRFFEPPPEKILNKLLDTGAISEEQAELAREIPMAQDITAEADSGGHTDHRPAIALFPTLLALRDRIQQERGYAEPLRLGLGGGISTPASALSAFAMGAAYVLTGTVNQACVESGTSDTVRKMLAEARQADVARAPAADMFEMGVTVQVLKRGTMFSMRGGKLYEHYRACKRLEDIADADREKLEKTVFGMTLDEVWSDTEAFFRERDPRQLERAARDPRHKMALVFRWYLGQSSSWANRGVEGREMDYQIWCGPAMGAFNEWVAGSRFEAPENRRVVDVARSILYGACVLQRVQGLRAQGVQLPAGADAIAVPDAAILAQYFETA